MVKREDLNQIVNVIKKRGIDISLERHYGKYRAFSANGSKELSPLLSALQMTEWLLAFLEGFDEGYSIGTKEAMQYAKGVLESKSS